MRRKGPVAPPKAGGLDEKKLAVAIKKLNTTPIPSVEEVQIFKEGGDVLVFNAPKGAARAAAAGACGAGAGALTAPRSPPLVLSFPSRAQSRPTSTRTRTS